MAGFGSVVGMAWLIFGVKSTALSLSMAISGIGGLGVLVRDGLVRPVSLVKSAVEATETLLAMDRLRSASLIMAVWSSAASSSD
jgi:hypothetical protein